MRTLRVITGISLLFASTVVFARGPAILFDTSNGQSVPVALVGVEEAFTDPLDNCTQHIANIIIDEVAYDGPSESIAGFRVDPEKSTNGVTLYRLNSSEITFGQMRELRKLFRKNMNLIVIAQTCGSGKFTSIREAWHANAMGK